MKKITKRNKSAQKSKTQKKKEIRKNLKGKSKKKKLLNSNSKENIIISNKEKIVNKPEDIKLIKSLIRDIFNLREMKRQLSFLGIDYKNLNFNSPGFFKSCFDILNKIYKTINSDELNHKSKKDTYFNLTKEYYKLVPHTFPFPDYNLFIINNTNKIKREICLLELIKSYSELEKTFSQIKYSKEENELNSLNNSLNESINIENITEEGHTNISNYFYEKALSELDYKIKVVDKKSKKFSEIEKAVHDYSTKCENGVFPPLKLLEVFSLTKENETINEINLLWFGCEIIHFYSILKNGFRLPFEEAPVNIFPYGKGILLSDGIYNQIQKCLPKNNIAYFLLCNIENLKPKKVHSEHYDYPEKLKKKYNSIFLRKKIKLPPFDKPNEEENDYIHSYDLIFYDLSLIQICYIVKVEFP